MKLVVFFLAMLLFTIQLSMAMDNVELRSPGGDFLCDLGCQTGCAFASIGGASLVQQCYDACMASCRGYNVEERIQFRTCSVDCPLSHCSKFLFQYDEKKFGGCMTSCRENKCVGIAKVVSVE